MTKFGWPGVVLWSPASLTRRMRRSAGWYSQSVVGRPRAAGGVWAARGRSSSFRVDGLMGRHWLTCSLARFAGWRR